MASGVLHSVPNEVLLAIEGTSGDEIYDVQSVGSRQGWSKTFSGRIDHQWLHIKLLRSIRETAFRAQGVNLRHVLPYRSLRELKSPLSSGERFLAIRERRSSTLADELPQVATSRTRQSIAFRANALKTTLDAIVSLHSIDVPHGDVRPDNIAVVRKSGIATLMDFGSSVPTNKLSDDELTFRGPGVVGTFTADIYAYGVLMDQVVENLALNEELGATGITVRQLEWLSEATRWASAHDRPDAEVLYSVLFDREVTQSYLADNVREARQNLLRMLIRENRTMFQFQMLEHVSVAAESRAIENFEAHPETMIYASKYSRLVPLLSNIPIDFEGDLVHTQSQEDELDSSGNHVTRFEHGLDSEFVQKIEADILERFGSSDAEDAQLEREEAIAFFAGFREQLLRESKYLDEDVVASLMSRPGLPLSTGQVAILRQWGELVAVHDHGRWLYPDFQFDATIGAPFAVVREVAKRFVPDENPWGILYWWLTPTSVLEGFSPATALQYERFRSQLPDLLPDRAV